MSESDKEPPPGEEVSDDEATRDWSAQDDAARDDPGDAPTGPLARLSRVDADDTVKESPEEFLGLTGEGHADDEFILHGDQEVTGQFMVPEGISRETRDESAQVFAPQGWPGTGDKPPEAGAGSDEAEVAPDYSRMDLEGLPLDDAGTGEPDPHEDTGDIAIGSDDADIVPDYSRMELEGLPLDDSAVSEPVPDAAPEAGPEAEAEPVFTMAPEDAPPPPPEMFDPADVPPPPPPPEPEPDVAAEAESDESPAAATGAGEDDWTKQFMAPGRPAPREEPAPPPSPPPDESEYHVRLREDDESTYIGPMPGGRSATQPPPRDDADQAPEHPFEDRDATQAIPREASGLGAPPAAARADADQAPERPFEDRDATQAIPREASGLGAPPAAARADADQAPEHPFEDRDATRAIPREEPIDEDEEMSTIMRAAPPPIIESTYGGELPPEEAPEEAEDDATLRDDAPAGPARAGDSQSRPAPMFEGAGRTAALPRSMMRGTDSDETADDRIEVAYSLKPDAVSSSTEERVVVRARRPRMPMRRKLAITAAGLVAGLIAGVVGRFMKADEAVAGYVESLSEVRIPVRVGVDQDLASSASGVTAGNWVRRGDIFLGHDIQESLFYLYDARHGLSLPTAMEVRIRRGPEEIGHLSLLGHSELGGVLLAWPTSRNIEVRRFENPMVRSVVMELPDSRVLRCLDIGEYFLYHPIPVENWNEPAWNKVLFCGENRDTGHFLQIVGVESRDLGEPFRPGGRLLAKPVAWFDTLSGDSRIISVFAAQDSVRVQSLEVRESLRRTGSWNLAPGSVVTLPWDSLAPVAVTRCRMGASPGWLVAQENRFAFIAQKPGGELELGRNDSGELSIRSPGEAAPIIAAFPGSADPSFDDAIMILPGNEGGDRVSGAWLARDTKSRSGGWIPLRPFRVPGCAVEPLPADFNADGAWDVLGFNASGGPWIINGRTGQPVRGEIVLAADQPIPAPGGELAWFVPRTDPEADGFYISADGKPVRLILELDARTHDWLERDRAWREERIPLFAGFGSPSGGETASAASAEGGDER